MQRDFEVDPSVMKDNIGTMWIKQNNEMAVVYLC